MAKQFLVCIDSDGCAFDTMEIKHKECFCPAYIRAFGLQPVAKYARDAWDFANLYSRWRGVHRFRALLKALEVLAPRKEVLERGFHTPELPELRAYVEGGNALTNDALEAYAAAHPGSGELRTVLEWSYDVNRRVRELVCGVPPFPHVRESLQKLSQEADIVVVSATPAEALEREWAEHDLARFTAAIKGQESGTKKEIIASLKGQYVPEHILMIGDAPGDLDAARDNGVSFYPICPDRESESWRLFESVFMDLFLNGRYRGEAENDAVGAFLALLPSEPCWLKG